MTERQDAVQNVILADPAVDNMNSYVGGSSWGGLSTGYLYINLKPRPVRDVTAEQVINRLRPKLAQVQGAQLFLQAGQDISVGGLRDDDVPHLGGAADPEYAHTVGVSEGDRTGDQDDARSAVASGLGEGESHLPG